ncbi:EAL domain-containing protein [Pediococcus ethanolidurans]|nr:EAL domain-containing protein [Pediococcus ethanolidurans]GEN94529.1 diguanylate cyclase [Pediococcus ethanolidurans]SER28564.1 EAL domain, c-di-GMP-specific phosphodiesterase class I (or its enzymatically inactive variant) [Pediococcus ethanolidurans]
MIRFWGQSKFSVDPLKPVGCELFLREKIGQSWVLPNNFDQFSPRQIADLLLQTVPALPKGLKNVSINLDPEQFIDPNFCDTLKKIKNQLLPVTLEVELTEHPANCVISTDQIRLAAKRWFDAGIDLVMDDVGSGENQIDRTLQLDPYVQEYKFAIQNFRQTRSLTSIIHNLSFWCEEAEKKHKLFTVEGIESKTDLELLINYRINMLQGFSLGHPVYLPTLAEQSKNSVIQFTKSKNS